MSIYKIIASGYGKIKWAVSQHPIAWQPLVLEDPLTLKSGLGSSFLLPLAQVEAFSVVQGKVRMPYVHSVRIHVRTDYNIYNLKHLYPAFLAPTYPPTKVAQYKIQLKNNNNEDIARKYCWVHAHNHCQAVMDYSAQE